MIRSTSKPESIPNNTAKKALKKTSVTNGIMHFNGQTKEDEDNKNPLIYRFRMINSEIFHKIVSGIIQI